VLHLIVTLWVCHRSIVNFNAGVHAKVLELPRSELSPIISDNVVGYTKYVHDLFDKFHYLGRCYLCGKLYFDPLCEFIHCYEDVCESTFSFLKWTYQI
jgi:hypothetical protein